MKRLGSAVFVCLLIAGSAFAQHDHSTMTGAEHASMDHDRMFADTMSKHHEDGIKMADLASRKAKSAELRDMATKMITDQRHEISELQHLRGDGPMTSMEAMMDMPGMMPMSEMQRDMARLEAASGAEFDRVFTEVMPKHHDGAIRMSEHYLTVGSNGGLKTLARQIIDKQTREREQLAAMHEQAHETMTSSAQKTTTTTETATDSRRRLRKD